MFGKGLRSLIIDVSVTKNSYILYIFRFLTNPRHRVGMRFMRKRDLQPQGPRSILSREFLTFYVLSVSKLASGVYKRGICIAYLHIHCLAGF